MRLDEDHRARALPDPMLGRAETGLLAGAPRAGVTPALRPTVFCPSAQFERCLAQGGC